MSLGNWKGTLTVGFDTKTVTVKSGDASCVIDKLPGVSTAKELSDFGNICDLPKGKVKNVLLGQTITLGLNMGISGNLAHVLLSGSWITTAAVDGGCGGTDPLQRECVYVDNVLDHVLNDYEYTWLDPAVLAALPDEATIADLFDLANRALGNADGVDGTEKDVSLGDINKAVTAINEAFDQCRYLIGIYEEKPVCGESIGGGPAIPGGDLASSLKVYPNPTTDKVNFEFTTATKGHVILEVYNIIGEKLATLVDKTLDKGVLMKVEYEPRNLSAGFIYYRLYLDGDVKTGKVVYIKNYKPE
jgi:hypothetical protein